MKLLTQEIRRQLPPLYSGEKNKDPIIQVKYFCPWNNWTWYATEFDGDDLFFGIVDGHFIEWGYFSLKELSDVCGPFGLRIERDLHFRPVPVSQIDRGRLISN